MKIKIVSHNLVFLGLVWCGLVLNVLVISIDDIVLKPPCPSDHEFGPCCPPLFLNIN